jgi:hypothetical protein
MTAEPVAAAPGPATVSEIDGVYHLTVANGAPPYAIDLKCTLLDGSIDEKTYTTSDANPILNVPATATQCSGFVNTLPIANLSVKTNVALWVFSQNPGSTQSPPDPSLIQSMAELIHGFKAYGLDARLGLNAIDPSNIGKTCANVRPNDLIFVVGIEHEQRIEQFSGNFPTISRSDASVYQCIDKSNATFDWSSSDELGLTYTANPVKPLGAVAALLTSPFVNKYRLWLAVPMAVLDSFDHHDRIATDTNNCEMHNLVWKYMNSSTGKALFVPGTPSSWFYTCPNRSGEKNRSSP